MPMLPDASAPEGMRLYAIGDVHGMLEPLREVHGLIADDLAARPVNDWRIIHIGDYIDRGPDSAGVLCFLADRSADPRVLAILGNHDEYLRRCLISPDAFVWADWRRFGTATLDSFGIDGTQDWRRLSDELARRVPQEIKTYLAELPLILRFGDFAFAHAGIRPGVALDAQAQEDLTWIREPFLSSTEDLGVVVVHGHTPTDVVEVRRNRIGIDTGAVFGGPLSCIVLEGTRQALLTPGGIEPLI